VDDLDQLGFDDWVAVVEVSVVAVIIVEAGNRIYLTSGVPTKYQDNS